MEDEVRAKNKKEGLLMRWLSRFIKKKLVLDVDPKINDLTILNDGELSQVHLDVTVNLPTKDFEKILDKLLDKLLGL